MALTYGWNVITAGMVDADSPLNQVLMDGIRENLIHNWEYIGGRDYTATDNHDHDGVNSKLVTSVADAAISQAKLKTTMGEISRQNGPGIVEAVLPGGEYGFFPQIKCSQAENTAQYWLWYPDGGANDLPTTYATRITWCVGDLNDKIWLQQRYVQASGEVHWVFFLRNKITKKVEQTYQAPDHPCFGNGGKPLLVSHPFGHYDPTIHEIVVINPSKAEIEEMHRAKQIEDETKPNRSLLEIMEEDYEIDEDSNPEWPKDEVTVGLPLDWNELLLGSKIKPIKKKIPKPEYVIVRAFKKKIK